MRGIDDGFYVIADIIKVAAFKFADIEHHIKLKCAVFNRLLRLEDLGLRFVVPVRKADYRRGLDICSFQQHSH